MSFILNPNTNRMIKVGGKPWRRLVRQGMLPNVPIQSSDNTIFEAKTVQDANQARDEILTEVEKKRAVEKVDKIQNIKRRGKKVVKTTPGPKNEDLARYTAQCASRTLHKHINNLNEQLEHAYSNSSELDNSQLKEFEDNLKELILQEMISGEVNIEPTVKTMKKKVDDVDFEVESLIGDSESADNLSDTDDLSEEDEKSD